MSGVNWLDENLDALVFFPLRCFKEETKEFADDLLAIFFDRYTDEATGLSTVHWENCRTKTLRRKASVYNGSISPTPIYDNGDPETGEIIGYTIWCGWHPQFLADIANPPVELAEHFEGVRIL